MNEAGRAAARLPGGHVEGFADTFGAVFTAADAPRHTGRVNTCAAIGVLRLQSP